MPELRFDGKAAIITGGGGALGRAYALMLAQRGASVLIEDLNRAAADKVVEEVRAAGGKAVACYEGVLDGEKIVKACLEAFGGVHIVINNAGHIMDVSFGKMQRKQWESINQVHLQGAFEVTRAAWPHMRDQKFGRIVNTSSPAGLYGSFGQANYSAAKLGLVGFSKTLAKEGEKYNIKANTIAPMAASPMLATVMPQQIMDHLKPEYIAALVVYLCHESCKDSGDVFECHGGWFAKLRWQRSHGAFLPTDKVSPDAVAANWGQITDFSNNSEFLTLDPSSPVMRKLAKL